MTPRADDSLFILSGTFGGFQLSHQTHFVRPAHITSGLLIQRSISFYSDILQPPPAAHLVPSTELDTEVHQVPRPDEAVSVFVTHVENLPEPPEDQQQLLVVEEILSFHRLEVCEQPETRADGRHHQQTGAAPNRHGDISRLAD